MPLMLNKIFIFCWVFLKHLFSHPASRAFLCLLEWGVEKEALPETRQTFAEVAAAQTSGLLNLVLSRQTGFFECEHPFFDKPMVLTEPVEANCRACLTKILLDSRRSLSLVLRQNRPFYRCGGHIELIRFKEYYRMPMGHEHISFVFSSAFRDIFS